MDHGHSLSHELKEIHISDLPKKPKLTNVQRTPYGEILYNHFSFTPEQKVIDYLEGNNHVYLLSVASSENNHLYCSLRKRGPLGDIISFYGDLEYDILPDKPQLIKDLYQLYGIRISSAKIHN